MLNREVERSINLAVDFNDMVLGIYMGNWPMVPFVVACNCEKSSEGQRMLNDFLFAFLTSTPSRARRVLD